jgi:hypothetical protein
MDAINVVSYGEFVKRLNDWQDVYSLDGNLYVVEECYAPGFGVQYIAKEYREYDAVLC